MIAQLKQGKIKWISVCIAVNVLFLFHFNQSKASEFVTGEHQGFTLTKRMFETPQEYLESDKVRKKYYKYCLKYSDPNEHLSYDIKTITTYLYVPENYKNDGSWGLYLHVNAGNRGQPVGSWVEGLKKHKLIYASPHGVENKVASPKRIGIALDTLATLQSIYSLDSKKIIIGGFSGGGSIACLTTFLFPDLFKGCISSARGIGLNSEFHYLSKKDIRKVKREDVRFCFITGEGDFNYNHIVKNRGHWEKNKLAFEIFDVPGMKHEVANAESFGAALEWIFTGKRTDQFLLKKKK